MSQNHQNNSQPLCNSYNGAALSPPPCILLTFSKLSFIIHLLIIPLVVARSDVVHPFLVVEVPADGALDAFLELERGLPAELALQLAAVYGVAHVVAEAVGDVGDEVEVLSLAAPEQTVDGVDYHADDVNVLPLVEAADVVGLGNLAFVEDEVNRTRVVLDEEPVAHILAFAIYRQRLVVTYVVYEQRYQFFGELVGPVVVGAVGHKGGHAVGVVIGAHEVVARCLGGGVR